MHPPRLDSLTNNEQREPQEITKELYRELPKVARELILSDRFSDTIDPHRQEFSEHPDDLAMHEPEWHQWGIITHTVMTGRYMSENVPTLMKQWFPDVHGKNMLGLKTEMIDGISKWDLLVMSVPLHDYGKFTRRKFKGMKKDGITRDFSFKGHEAESGNIVRTQKDQLMKKGLTQNQVEYLARCAELHFELGKVRDVAKKSGEGFTNAYVESDSFKDSALAIAHDTPEYTREIGIFFIADSLGKTDLHHTVGVISDAERESKKLEIETELQKRGLPNSLIAGALQLGVNIAAAQRYLKLISENK